MGVIFDTSEIIAIERKSHDIHRIVDGREEEQFGISVITVAELLHGVERADTHPENKTAGIRREGYRILSCLPDGYCGRKNLCQALGITFFTGDHCWKS
jgi:predicted nucleic acid-binding protein